MQRQLSFLPAESVQHITFDEILLGQTSIVAPEGAKLEERFNIETKQNYLVKKYDHIVCTQDGKLKQVEMEIETLGSEGVTDYFDDRVLLALHTLSIERDAHAFKTTISEIAHTLNLPLNGEYISRIRRSLSKLNGTSIGSDQFLDPDTNELITQRIALLPEYKLYRDEKRSIVVEKNGVLFDEKIVNKKEFHVAINPFFFKSLKKQKILLDIDFLNTLRNKTIEKFYRFLNTIFHSQTSIDLSLKEFCEVLGVKAPAYISNIKRNLYNRYIKDMERNKIINRFDFKKNFYKKDGEWRVFFERGEFYEELQERYDMKPFVYSIYSFLTSLGFKKQEIYQILDSRDDLHDILPDIKYLKLAMDVTPQQIRTPRAWLKKAVAQNPPWDYTHNMEILEELAQKKSSSLTDYQKSWDKRDMNQQEKKIYTICTKIFNINQALVLQWVKLHKHFEYIRRLNSVYTNLQPREQKPEFLVHIIQNEDR
jgi:hypothetical protein